MSCRFGPTGDPEKYRFIQGQGLFKGEFYEFNCGLSPTALKLLGLFVATPGVIKSPRTIAESLDGSSPEVFARTYIKQIRARLGGEGYDAISTERGLGYKFNWKILDDGPPALAVLPFTRRGRESDDGYIAGGLTDDLIDILMKSPELTVVRSAVQFKDEKTRDYPTIGEMLGVGFLVEGTIEQSGNSLRVYARLINTRSGVEVWRDRYLHQVTDKFAVRDEIANAIAEAMRVKLTKGGKVIPEHVPHPDAHEAFWKGRHQFYKYSKEPSALAAEHFRHAIELDPRWAAPHSALAYELLMSGILGWQSLSDVTPLARAEAEKALRLHASEPIAHMVLGAIASVHEYDWETAETHFKLAIASESVPPEVHVGYAQYFLMPLGRFEDAAKQCRSAIKKDPLNAVWRTRLAGALLCAENYDSAIAEAQNALEYDAKNYSAHYLVAMGYAFQQREAEARESAENAVRLGAAHDGTLGLLAGILANAGEIERAGQLCDKFRPEYHEGRIMYHLIRKEIDEVLKWYERNIELRVPGAAMLAAAGFHKPTRSSPRWPRLARMMKLPQIMQH